MARGGFFGRVFKGVKDLFRAPPAREEPSEPDEPSPRRSRRDPFQQIWLEETLGRPGRHYGRHKAIFESIPGITDDDEETREDLWRSYLENMVAGHHRRNDLSNPFWSDVGIDPRDFDWDDWRAAMGYKRRR